MLNNYYESPRLQTAVKILSLLIVIIAAITAHVWFKADTGTILLFIAFVLFAVLMPGLFVLENIGIKSSHLSTAVARGFFAGIALNIIVYYLSALTGVRSLLFLIGPLLSLLWLVRFFRNGIKERLSMAGRFFASVPASFFFFAACVFLGSMYVTQFDYIAPGHVPYSFLRTDFEFHSGLINALAEGYPPKNPWVDGRIITYHYYSEMLLSIPVRIFGLPSDGVLMSGTPYLIAPVFSISMYSAFRELMSDKKKAGLYCLSFHFSNMFMLKVFTSSWIFYQIYSNVNSAGLGLACFLVVLPLLREWDGVDMAQSSTGARTLFFALLVMLMTGIKGPISIVLVAGMIGTLLLALILRRSNRHLISITLLSVLSFILIYVYVLGGEHANASGGAVLNLGEVTDLFFLKIPLMESGLPRVAALALVFILFVFFYFTAFIVPFIVGYIREFVMVITRKKEFEFSKVCFYACFFVGFVGLMIFNFSGHSQVYFGFAASVLIPFISFWLLEDIKESRTSGAKIVRACFAVMMAFFALTTAYSMCKSAAYIPKYLSLQTENRSRFRNVTVPEYEGLSWLRDNTDADALCASDRFSSVAMDEYDYTMRNNNTHFAYAVYSQRRQYIEGSGYSLFADENDLRKEMVDTNMKMFDKENEDRGDLARSLGVDYVVVSKRFNDCGDLSNADYTLCFSNEEMDIYKVNYPD